MNQQVRGLSLFALTMVAIGSTIGSGIFKTPSDIASDVPDASWMLGLWVLGGLISMAGALVFAELGARLPKAGGVYAYLHEAYGALPAFLYGWCLLTVVSSGTIAALIVVFADFIQPVLGVDAALKPVLAAASIVVLTLFNTFGIRSSEWFANISTVLKIVGIYGLLIVALFLGDRSMTGETAAAAASDVLGGNGFNLAGGLVGVLWSYTGWHYASFVAGDAINPKRNVPIAMIAGTGVVTLTYVLCNMGYLKVFDIAAIQSSETLAADAINTVLPGSGHWVSVLIAVSVFGCAGLYVLATPRIIQQMAVEGLFFSAFARRHPKFNVPLNAILLQSAWAIVLVFYWGKFESLYTYVTITEWLFLLAACAGIFIIRRKMKGQETAFRTPLYPVLPILFCAVVAWFITRNVVSENSAAYAGLLIIPVGILVYYLFRKRSGRSEG